MQVQPLVGREAELASLGALVERARHGSAGSVVVRGEPGVGKSALLEAVVGDPGESTVLRTRGLEVEAPLAFASLHRLLRPLLPLRDRLPAPQARALGVAFGEADGPPVEPFLVGVATLSLLTTAAEDGLVVCLLDDAHWMDQASADALLFCARRIGADRVAMLFATREGVGERFEAAGVDELVLRGLGAEAARALLAQRVGTELVEHVVERLLAEADGNPLALLELPGGLTAAQLGGTAILPAHLQLTDRVEGAFLERSRRLPEPVQDLLLLVAADDAGRLDVLRQACDTLGLDEDVVEGGIASGLLTRGANALSLRHPLVRSAVYQAASDSRRRAIHAALAEALAGAGEQDREVWHRTHAAAGPDDSLVAALEGVGDRAQRRGGYAAALTAYLRAAELCAERPRRAALAFAAARSAWAGGQATRAQVLLSEAREDADDPVLVCDVARLRGHIEVNIGSAPEAHRIFVEAAHDVLSYDPVRALEAGVAAAVMRTYGADSGTPLRSVDLLDATADDGSARTRCLRQMLLAMTLVAESQWSEATEALELALAIGEDVDDRDVLWNLGNAALQLGHDDRQQQFYSYALSRARESGAVTAVIYCLQRLCFGHHAAGDHVALRISAEEAVALAEGIGQRAMTALPTAWLALLAAQQGSDDHEDLLARVDEVVAGTPLGITTDPVHDLAAWSRSVRAVGVGDVAGAHHHLDQLRLPFIQRLAATERMEVASRAGEVGAVRAWTDSLEVFAAPTGHAAALAAVSFGRALTSDGDAEPLFEAALAAGADAGRPVDLARIHLVYGEWLRRHQRRVDARVHLRRALETFRDVRAEALASRAEQELRASGETARKRDPSTLVDLTPTELKIAQLVSAGLSNKDVAAQCWISPRTVAFHLRNVFAKTGVTSRGELAGLDLA
ncbi:DNA-binding CsgD family transcriptional regulator/tetratricopeptide (TPR) repeat protein [Nocardioides sp. BE266]|uniref:helix-turn-helix transcriptional regulator n=1 Tax=Nocardioides sp. BE266 TaxID=2817725 RepID=UPI002857AAB2|nr:AAA family ATPase [Nocardioides sp. BE266]MDR7255157.1 DNA-binding CsgD family transcriptional regulator/tetratricopeptide (TPR) repeat protein [Nocardioides sp. BE266]